MSNNITVMDSHQHFWKYDPVEYAWISEEMQVLRRDFLPEDLKAIFDQEGVDSCIAVQAAQTEAETDFLLGLAQQHAFIQGVVGWVDLRSPEVEARLAHYAQFKKLSGFRHIVQGEPDPLFMVGAEFKRGIALLEKYEFTYDILVFPTQLDAALELVKAFPSQPFVIDHLAKPYIKAGHIEAWALLMKRIAQQENVLCKISGMVTEADWSSWSYETLAPYIEAVFEAFGADRVMYGSDWPVCLLGGEYKVVKGVLDTYVSKLSAAEQAKIWGQNARTFYGTTSHV